MGTIVAARGNYVKVAVYYAPDASGCGLDSIAECASDAARVDWPLSAIGYNSPVKSRVDSFIWPFTTAAEGEAALESALNVLDEVRARGLDAKLSIFKRAPSVPALDSVAVIFLRELGDEYDD